MAGIGADRLQLAWVSSAEAQRFVEIATDTIAAVKEQGPLDTVALEMALEAADMTVNNPAIRWLVGKEVKITANGDVYGRKWDVDQYETALFKELEREFQKSMIFLAIKKGCKSVRDISREIGLDLLRISYLLADLEKTNQVEFTGMEDSKPVFVAL